MSETPNRPVNVRTFGTSSCRIAVKKWEANKEKDKPESYFIELSHDTGRKTSDNKSIWQQIPLACGDVSAVAAELLRAGAFAQQKEDAVHA